MTELFLGAILVIALVVTLQRGALWAFAWVLIPIFILVPPDIQINLPLLPVISPRRVVCLGILVGMMLQGMLLRRLPHPTLVDMMLIATIIWFSISFGLRTSILGFVHKLSVFGLDWLLPYFLARHLLRDIYSLRIVIGPIAICVAIHGMAAAYEARMIARVGRELWEPLISYIPDHWLRGGARRWGYLRAFGFFTHPIYTGVLFATLVPLIPLWTLFQRKSFALVAAAAGLAGLLAALSRGPWLAFTLASSLYAGLNFFRPRVILPIGIIVLFTISPFLIEMANESIEYTQSSLEQRGNVESGHYRLALLLIYGRRIGEVGWFGEPSIIATEYASTWSIDNAYLQLFIDGGWGGGGLMLAIVVYQLLVAFQAVTHSSGVPRKVRACIGASFTSVALCMVNVWFSPDYAPFFFFIAALITNSSHDSFFSTFTVKTLPDDTGLASYRIRRSVR